MRPYCVRVYPGTTRLSSTVPGVCLCSSLPSTGFLLWQPLRCRTCNPAVPGVVCVIFPCILWTRLFWTYRLNQDFCSFCRHSPFHSVPARPKPPLDTFTLFPRPLPIHFVKMEFDPMSSCRLVLLCSHICFIGVRSGRVNTFLWIVFST